MTLRNFAFCNQNKFVVLFPLLDLTYKILLPKRYTNRIQFFKSLLMYLLCICASAFYHMAVCINDKQAKLNGIHADFLLISNTRKLDCMRTFFHYRKPRWRWTWSFMWEYGSAFGACAKRTMLCLEWMLDKSWRYICPYMGRTRKHFLVTHWENMYAIRIEARQKEFDVSKRLMCHA